MSMYNIHTYNIYTYVRILIQSYTCYHIHKISRNEEVPHTKQAMKMQSGILESVIWGLDILSVFFVQLELVCLVETQDARRDKPEAFPISINVKRYNDTQTTSG